MNDLTVSSKMPVYSNQQLNSATRKVFEIGNKMKKNLYAVAVILSSVEESECYKDDGFKSAADYAMKTFGFQKSAAYSLIKIGKEYTNKAKQESNIPHDLGKDYSTTQIEKLLPLGREKILELNENKIINPSMTVKEIREIVKKYSPIDSTAKEEKEVVADESTVEGKADEPKAEEKADESTGELQEDVEFPPMQDSVTFDCKILFYRTLDGEIVKQVSIEGKLLTLDEFIAKLQAWGK